jgi:glycine dehydrogenase subunit 2
VAYKNPDEPKNWPLNTSVGRVNMVKANHPKYLAPTWRVHVKRLRGELN